MTKNEVTRRSAGGVPAPISDPMALAADLAGAGMETVTAADLLIPRLTIIQDLSPQRKKSNPRYINGAELGDICDTGMGRVYDAIEFVPVVYRRQWIEWGLPRGVGGIVQIHNTPAILQQCTNDPETGQPRLPNGHPVVETPQFSGMMLMPGDASGYLRAFIAMPGSQRRKAKRWLNIATATRITRQDGAKVTAPLWWNTYMLGSIAESNDRGEWHGWTVEVERPTHKAMESLGVSFQDFIEDAKEFTRAITEGSSRLDMSADAVEAADEEIPF